MKEHILVVEDEPDIQELIKFNLERKRYSVAISESGEEALISINKIKPKLILLDIMLPGIDGLEVLKELKELPMIAYLRYASFEYIKIKNCID